MSVLSIDLNTTRVRAVQGAVAAVPATVPLEKPRADLPMVLAVERGRPRVGSPGLSLQFDKPDLVCRDFLPRLGKQQKSTRWAPRGHALAPVSALTSVLEIVQHNTRAKEVFLAVPPYLEEDQVDLVLEAARHAKLAVNSCVASPLAVCLAGHAEAPWTGAALVVDVDDHAFWMSLLQEKDGQAHLVQTYLYPRLSLYRWKQRLANALADCCILQTRRDPREFVAAEKTLWLQLDDVMEKCVQNRPADVSFQAAKWYQNILLQPEETESFCTALVRAFVKEVQALLQATWHAEPVTALFMTGDAAKLPGLAVGLEDCLDQWYHLVVQDAENDGPHPRHEFANEEEPDCPQVVMLSADAVAQGTHLLATDVLTGAVEAGLIDRAAPLPEVTIPTFEEGPARLHYQGRDYPLGARNFLLGRRHDSDLIFDRHRFPAVCPSHCEIIHDPRMYFLKDLSKTGTWINDRPVTQMVMLRPGDQIRLGPGGPTVQFLGRPKAQGITTIA